MPWYGTPITTTTTSTSGIDFLVDLLRMKIADQKLLINNVVREENATLCTGGTPETYYTKELPIAAGYSTILRIGRWKYGAVDDAVAASGERSYVFNTTSGSFYVPDDATPGTDGDIAKLTYSWSEEQEYKFSDHELKLYVQDAVVTINNGHYDFGHTVTGAGDSLEVSPQPVTSDISSYLYVMYSTYLVRKQLESEGFDNRIYVRDLNVTIDTSKGLGDLSKSSKVLMDEFSNVIYTLRVKGQEAAFMRIDTYSTYANESDDSYKFEVNHSDDSDFF